MPNVLCNLLCVLLALIAVGLELCELRHSAELPLLIVQFIGTMSDSLCKCLAAA